MKLKVPGRRDALIVFTILGGVFLILALVELTANVRLAQVGTLLSKHEWSNPEFTDLVLAVAYLTAGSVFMLFAFFVKRAKAWGLLALAVISTALFVWSLFDAKGLLLALLLGLASIALFVELYKTSVSVRKKAA